MKKEEKKRKVKTKYIVLSAVFVVCAIMLAVALSNYLSNDADILGTHIIHSELIYTITVLMAILPVALIILFVVFIIRRRRQAKGCEKDDLKIVLDGAPEATQIASDTSVATKKEDKKVQGSVSRFDGLTRLDARSASFARNDYNTRITLRGLCENFRNFSASKLKLYYDISDIRRFIAGMAVSHIQILQGMSGTGKTSLAYAFGEYVDNTSTVIPVQPMWKERTDLIGYYNEFTKRFNETELLKKMYEANYSKDMYVTVLDEMNIARVEYYFAEFLSLLELPDKDKRYLSVVSEEWDNDPVALGRGKIKLPPNMWFIGTANNDDSTFAISDKVYDRAMIMTLDNKAEAFIAPRTKKIHISADYFEELVAEALKEYKLTTRNEKRLEKLDEYMIENFHITFGNRIMKQIRMYVPVYVSCGGEELEALDDILSKKVMRKLSMQNPVYIRNSAERFCQFMDELFGESNMKLCKDFIHRLEKNA
jgi:hypothetical protein